jgi:hypothetical protein
MVTGCPAACRVNPAGIKPVPETRKIEDMGETSTAPLAGNADVAAGGRALHARTGLGAATQIVNASAAQAR